jgi:hypothetical protein
MDFFSATVAIPRFSRQSLWRGGSLGIDIRTVTQGIVMGVLTTRFCIFVPVSDFVVRDLQ